MYSGQNETNYTGCGGDYSSMEICKALLDAEYADLQSFMLDICTPLGYSLSAAGLIGNTLSLLVLHRSATKFYTVFRRIILATSALDAVFIVTKVSKETIPVTDDATMTLTLVLGGVSYSCSLMSDCLALTLTAERFLALVYPLKFQTLAPGTIRNYWIVSCVVSALIALTRMHYALSNFKHSLVNVRFVPFLSALQYFSDTVVPLTLTFLTVLLVLGMSYAVMTRRRIHRTKPAQMVDNGQTVKKHELTNAVSLLWSLLVFCFLDQAGYICFDISEKIMEARDSVEFLSVQQLYAYHDAKMSYMLWAYLSSITEVLARSGGFYLYLCFNKTFRIGFLEVFSVCRRNRQTHQPVGISAVSIL